MPIHIVASELHQPKLDLGRRKREIGTEDERKRE
jgi:hypothetical protein